MELAGKTAVVTGASTGIGNATAQRLAAEGAQVVVAARSAEKLDTLVDEIESAGGSALAVPTDVADEDDIDALFESTTAEYGGVDVLVNNAGVGYWNDVAESNPSEWRQEVEVNLLGLMFATRLAVQDMRDRGVRGHVVNVTSLSGRYPGPGWPSYTASKFGANGFTESIMEDVKADGIRVTLVAPGETDTPMQTGDYDVRILDAEDVADAIWYAVTRPEHVLVNEIEIRPTGAKRDD